MRRLKNLRVDTGKTQKEIADILGVDRTTYVKYEMAIVSQILKCYGSYLTCSMSL